jgi:hypothetical protein
MIFLDDPLMDKEGCLLILTDPSPDLIYHTLTTQGFVRVYQCDFNAAAVLRSRFSIPISSNMDRPTAEALASTSRMECSFPQ